MKKYKIIYADPPWKQKAGRLMSGYKIVNGKQIWNSEHVKSENLSYPTMSIADIKNMPIGELADNDCCLFMWVTNAYLPYAFEIISQWGFKYSTTLVWAKNLMGGGLGGTFRITTEFLIFAKKGKIMAKEVTPSTWFNIKRTYENGVPKNSKKPTYFYELIESKFDGPFLELFAREQREGWDVFGNQVENSILLTKM
jgi:N6-adenosine-specific RNA methylase IME4